MIDRFRIINKSAAIIEGGEKELDGYTLKAGDIIGYYCAGAAGGKVRKNKQNRESYFDRMIQGLTVNLGVYHNHYHTLTSGPNKL